MATVVLDAVASVIVFLFEREAAGTGITSLGDSVFWTSTQLLTVSSQLPNPFSTPARVFDIFLQAYAIFCGRDARGFLRRAFPQARHRARPL